MLTRIRVVGLMLLLVSTPSLAQDKIRPSNGDITFKSVQGLNQPGVGPELIGGKPAKTQDWPASFYSSSDDGGSCTSTLIGPQALLLAAHCVGNNRRAFIEVGNRLVGGTCTHAPEYVSDDSADYALCLLEQMVDTVFETIELDPRRVKKGDRLLLTGFGCTKPSVTGAGVPGNDGIFRIGRAAVVSLPGETEPNSIVTQDDRIVCPGDSGGGAYAERDGVRRLVSVNSRVIFSEKKSLLSSVATPAGRGFIERWATSNQQAVCGLNAKGEECR